MKSLYALLAAMALLLTACGGSTGGSGGYRISSGDTAKIQYRTLDSINSYRTAAGLSTLQLNSQLNSAASSHSRDMSAQNRPWHFGSDGSSPLERVARAGYSGKLLGENISETYESEVETLGAWMDKPDTRNVIMDPEARDLGIAWYQEKNGKIWWTLITGGYGATALPAANPAAGIQG
ncbi:CAP domain-containing protein [Tropicimonas sp. TH_r6]|uniref:CAP domain-containing protein n=1 Tax=Tropicimonas sp. TH_r6 TaxID=3082085 RepID=UPI0029534433|nr:CAP domain-containing protein [Tropicimonas sp. TH_r6]MDV7141260.1 CAP domain-containing protein [Tropicimonas sp. TH_r6]